MAEREENADLVSRAGSFLSFDYSLLLETISKGFRLDLTAYVNSLVHTQPDKITTIGVIMRNITADYLQVPV